MDSNLSLYHIFHTVASKGNISYAAKELFISQPAISKAIHKLEQNLDVTLFSRSSRGVTLTEQGKLLYEYTSTAFHALDRGEEYLRRMKTLETGHLRIGVSTTLCKYILLPYLKDFIAEYPHIKVTIDCQSTFHTIKLLTEHKVDIGLIAKPEDSKHLHFYSTGELEDIFVTTKTYLRNLKLRERDDHVDVFRTANLMLLDEENISRLYIDNYFREHQIKTNQILEISNMDLLIEFAKIGLGVACVVKKFVQEDLDTKRLLQIPLNVPIPTREVGFAYTKERYSSDVIEKFITFYSETRQK